MTNAERLAWIERVGGFTSPGTLAMPEGGVFEFAGMSLRDHIAALAVPGIMAMVATGTHELPNPKGAKGCAIEAYRVADAMLEESAKLANATTKKPPASPEGPTGKVTEG